MITLNIRKSYETSTNPFDICNTCRGLPRLQLSDFVGATVAVAGCSQIDAPADDNFSLNVHDIVA
jgi:hypothetical protein